MSLAASKKAKDTKALPLSDTLRDLALLRASDVDLAALLPPKDKEDKGSLSESTEFIAEARKALKVQDRGDVEMRGKKLDDVRKKFEDLLAGVGPNDE